MTRKRLIRRKNKQPANQPTNLIRMIQCATKIREWNLSLKMCLADEETTERIKLPNQKSIRTHVENNITWVYWKQRESTWVYWKQRETST